LGASVASNSVVIDDEFSSMPWGQTQAAIIVSWTTCSLDAGVIT